MPRVVIVGGGVGGLACAQRLAGTDGSISAQLVADRLRHDFAPSFLWLMTGQRRPEQVSRPLAALSRRGVPLTEAEVGGVDLTAGSLTTSSGEIPFDELVLAPGATLAPDIIPGLVQTDGARVLHARGRRAAARRTEHVQGRAGPDRGRRDAVQVPGGAV